MKIIYVAKHGCGYNQDEDAIGYALERLGHEITRVQELKAHSMSGILQEGDFLLFHHWNDFPTIRALDIKKVFWNFDLVFQDDPSLRARNQARINWMQTVTSFVDLGFCSDGDWVHKDTTGKLVRLTQGADERILGFGTERHCRHQILFTGTEKGGQGRLTFVKELQLNYKKRFLHAKNCFREDLKDLIACSQVCVAPDAPITDHYWSNRVYVYQGFGALLLHPYSETLTHQYQPNTELVYYRDRPEFHNLIRHYIRHPEERRPIQEAALKRTEQEHLYRHRCEALIQTVKERLF